MTFKSKRDPLFGGIIIGIGILLLVATLPSLLQGITEQRDYIAAIMVFTVVCLLLWLFFGTYYRLDNNGLFYSSGPLRGTIPLEQIHEVVRDTTLWVGLKPATARNGLIIKYQEYNKIYISPASNDAFIEKLVELNPNIKISS